MLKFKRSKVKEFFFDGDLVKSSVDRATARVLGKFGAFVRRTAKGMIRGGKKPSKPGSPPKSHTGLLKKFLYFAWDPASKSVVVGPARLDGDGLGTAPETLERGGTAMVRALPPRSGRRATRKQSKAFKRLLKEGRIARPTRARTRRRRVSIAARPYMAPAFAENKPKLDSLWENSVKG